MSTFLPKRRLTAKSAGTGPTTSKRQRLIDATIVLLDVAKESADVCPPLKSCLGGINALIKHYDQVQDVKDKLEVLIPWVVKLGNNLIKANAEDHEEIERRTQLIKSLDDIEKRSLALSDKGRMARVLDKAQDAQAVVRLIDQLQKSILVYQMSQQQSIYNQVVQLTSSFGVFLKLNEKTPEITRKITSVLARLDRLGAAVNGAGNGGELKQHMVLFETLESIKDKLLVISNHSTTAGYQTNEADMQDICELSEVLRDAVVEYQFVQQKAIYHQSCKLIDAGQICSLLAGPHIHNPTAELLVLRTCPYAPGAGYQDNSLGCLTGTRVAILDGIESWTRDFDKSPVYWLNGLAGTGKSAIAQTTAKRLLADGRLGASFFCSRNFKDCCDLHLIFPTLSIQLAHRYPRFRSTLIPLLQLNPDIKSETLHNQMETLIVTPLRDHTDISMVIVIDALDECTDDEPQSAILSVVARFLEEIPNIKFFITGRPEPHIQSGFRLKLLRPLTKIFILHMVDHCIVNTDIQQFLEVQLSEFAQQYQLTGWPSDKHVNLLCQRAAGLFVYAVATVKFLDHPVFTPSEQLDKIINLPEHTAYEGATRLKNKTTLDSLYSAILQIAFDFGGEDPEVNSRIQSIIGTVVLLVNPLPQSAVAELIGLEALQVKKVLTSLQSLLVLNEDPNCPVKPFHKSFPDFITDPSRCPNERFYISPEIYHHKLTLNCLRLMNDALEPNLLLLPECALNKEVKDLQDRIKVHVSPALEYACKFWYDHLTKTKEDNSQVLDALDIFLKQKFLPWLEIISVIGATSDVVVGLKRLILWLNEVAKNQQLTDMVRDYFHFVTKFFEVISVSAPHIYHSALVLSPQSSVVQEYYYCHPFWHLKPRVLSGLPSSWDHTRVLHHCYVSYAWSPCGQYFSTLSSTSVEEWDATTLEKRSSLQPCTITETEWPKDAYFPGALAYSPDGHSLACFFGSVIVIWDLQTGGVVGEIETNGPGICHSPTLVWSSDGTTIYASYEGEDTAWVVTAYNIAFGKVYSNMVQSSVKPHLWLHGTFLWVMAIVYDNDSQATINILEIQPNSINNLIESFPVNNLVELLPRGAHAKISFCPATYQISTIIPKSGYKGTLFAFDIQSSKVLVEREGYLVQSGSHFSPDGRLLVASDVTDTIVIWEYTPEQGYALWMKLQFKTHFWDNLYGYKFSPSSSMILILSAHRLEVHNLEGPRPNSLEKIRHHVIFLNNPATCVITASDSGSTFTITNLQNSSSQCIDTKFKIERLDITCNTLLVQGEDVIAVWQLTTEGTVNKVLDNTGGDSDGRLWTKPVPPTGYLQSSTYGHIRAIKTSQDLIYYYDTETGVELDPITVNTPAHSFSRWEYLGWDKGYSDGSNWNCIPGIDHPTEYHLKYDKAKLHEGWVKYSEGDHQYQFWLPPEWRHIFKNSYWVENVTTVVFDFVDHPPVIIKL